MSGSKPVDPAVSMDDPRSVFGTPDTVLDSALSNDEKHAILMRWLEDEKALLRASSEGMSGGEQPMVQRVEQALETVESERA
jgi:hypothetical protein